MDFDFSDPGVTNMMLKVLFFIHIFVCFFECNIDIRVAALEDLQKPAETEVLLFIKELLRH